MSTPFDLAIKRPKGMDPNRKAKIGRVMRNVVAELMLGGILGVAKK